MIYLDNNATTALHPQVIEAIRTELEMPPANPSSPHALGRAAKQRLTKAREEVARAFSVSPKEVIFTSGGTEAMHFLIYGFAQGHIITSDIEHACVYKTLKNFPDVTFLPAGLKGYVSVEQVRSSIRPDTKLIVLSGANSETGVKNPLEELGQLAFEHSIPFIVDGVALLGKEPFHVPKGVRGIGFSGHKIHGPKGIGCVILQGKPPKPLFLGGEQEYGLRSGTENLPGIIGFAKALSLLKLELPGAPERMCSLRDAFEKRLLALPGVVRNGEGPRLSNTSNLSFEGIGGEDLLISLDLAGVAVSHGSACASFALEPSRVLLNMGISPEKAKSALRFSLSRYTTQEEMDRCADLLIQIVKKIRA